MTTTSVPKVANSTPLETGLESPAENKPVVKWTTTEVVMGGAAAAVLAFTSLYLSYGVSSRYRKSLSELTPGWLGPYRDESDHQWETVRRGIPALVGFFAAHCLLGGLANRLLKLQGNGRLYFEVVFGGLACFYVHRACTVHIAWISSAMFGISHLAVSGDQRARCLVPWLTFGLATGVLLTMHWDDGWQFETLSPGLRFMDMFRGLYRWNVGFNITILKLVSFNMDLYWASDPDRDSGERPRREGEDYLSYKNRQLTPRPLSQYDVFSFYGYVLYQPLYLAGPTATFNAWRSYIESPQTTYDWKYLVVYAARLLFAMLAIEALMHNIYTSALISVNWNRYIWHSLTPGELAGLLVMHLTFLYLKFLILWRFFRLWSLIRGVDCPENMPRCIFTSFSVQEFWRNWHRSFYLWILRYIYIPLGGGGSKLWVVPVIFTYAAIWHECSLSLAIWGCATALVMLPEMFLRQYTARHVSYKFKSTQLWKIMLSAGVSFNIILLVLANVIGFSFGSSGAEQSISTKFWTSSSIEFWLFAVIGTFIAGPCALYLEECRKNPNYCFGFYR
eukprot:GHVU01103170.1.p1 GENE.GHVU01103170.1~~GHVU01103170.1.p1  ORF type:complete len:562 (+),score=26.44 GHVU01103170.1:199-1884(+)